jgi:hypothetical protein
MGVRSVAPSDHVRKALKMQCRRRLAGRGASVDMRPRVCHCWYQDGYQP